MAISDDKLKVGIFIPTKDRSDFIVRQLKYYAAVECPHTIYIGDSSDDQHQSKIREIIGQLQNKIKIIYEYLPPSRSNMDVIYSLLSMIKEPYACFNGDDDYQIPNSLTKCAAFLEKNKDYATASGQAVSFRLKNNNAYGELDYVSNYPRPYIESETASQRITKFLDNYYVPLFSVNRTEQMAKNWKDMSKFKDVSFGGEMTPSALSIIAGKSATLSCLGFVRQIHNKNYFLPNTFDWITGPEWNESYRVFEGIISENIAKKDNMPLEDAVKITKLAFLAYLQKHLVQVYDKHFPTPTLKNNPFYKNILTSARYKIVKIFPFLKYIYRVQIKPRLTGKKEMHYEVTRTGSSYSKDFKIVMDSFTGKL